MRDIAKALMPFHRYARSIERRLIDDCGPFSDNSLDMGCGDRSVRFKNTIGLDINKNLKPDIVCDIAKMPIRDSCIEQIVSNSVFEHVKELPGMMREANRVSKNGCRIMCTIGSDIDDDYPDFFKKISAIIYKHINNFGIEDWSELFRNSGFEVIRKIKYVPRTWHFLFLLSCIFPPAAIYGKLAERIDDKEVGIFMECRKI